MACKKWESDGLLYIAGDLSNDESSLYETHLSECEECSLEVNNYKEMFGDFSAKELLSEEPSAECDQKILAAIDDVVSVKNEDQPIFTMGGFFATFIQRVALPLAIFAIAIGIGVQVSSRSTREGTIAIVEPVDTLQDSTDTDSGRIFIEGGGDGVIPVDLEEDQ